MLGKPDGVEAEALSLGREVQRLPVALAVGPGVARTALARERTEPDAHERNLDSRQ